MKKKLSYYQLIGFLIPFLILIIGLSLFYEFGKDAFTNDFD